MVEIRIKITLDKKKNKVHLLGFACRLMLGKSSKHILPNGGTQWWVTVIKKKTITQITLNKSKQLVKLDHLPKFQGSEEHVQIKPSAGITINPGFQIVGAKNLQGGGPLWSL